MRAVRMIIAALIVFFAVTAANAFPPQPQVFTGPDIGKVFRLLRLPEFPYEARRNSWSGRGTFRAHVAADGTVTRVDVIKSTGHKALDDVVVVAARRWRAHPGRKVEVDFPMAFIAPPRPPSGLPQ